MTNSYQVFISYRRDGGFETAKHLFDLLTLDGYQVSFDLDSLRSGPLNKNLLRRIDSCSDFIIILNQECFTRTLDPTFPQENDWVRQELAYALQKKKNVVPIRLAGFEFPHELPDDIKRVANFNGPQYSQEYFDAFYKKLKNNFLKTRLWGARARWLIVCVILSLLLLGAVRGWLVLRREPPQAKESVAAVEKARREREATSLAALRTMIKIKEDKAKTDMEMIKDFRADPVGFERHVANADDKWNIIKFTDKKPEDIFAAEASLKLIENAGNEIAGELEWLKANRAARDEVKGIEAEIRRAIVPELERVNASSYAHETFLAGERMRKEGNAALDQGDFSSAKGKLLAARTKLAEAVSEARPRCISDLWDEMKPEVLAIRLEYEKNLTGNLLVAHVPQMWFDHGEVQLTLDLMRGTNVVERIQEQYKARTALVAQEEKGRTYQRVEMKCPARKTKGIDAYMLNVQHRSWPVALRFIPPYGVDIETGSFRDEVSKLVQASITFIGENRELLKPIPREEYACKDRVDDNEAYRMLKFSSSVLDVHTNGILCVQAKGQDYGIAYTNEAATKCHVVVYANFLNPLGARIFATKDEKTLGALEGGESLLLMPQGLHGCELPSYVELRWTLKQ